jgi:hypothetical protein
MVVKVKPRDVVGVLKWLCGARDLKGFGIYFIDMATVLM